LLLIKPLKLISTIILKGELAYNRTFGVFCEIKDLKKLSILFLTYQGDVAGSTNSIAYLARGLADRGHNIHIGIRKESLLWTLLEGSKVNRIAMTFKGKFDFKNWRQIKDAVRTHNIELINAQSSHDRYTSIFSKLRFNLNVQIVHTRRQNPLSSGGWLQRKFYQKNTVGTVVISDGLKKIFVKNGYPEKHVKVINNGIPKKRFEDWSEDKVTAFRKQLNLQPNDKVVGCISRFKEQPQLVEAIASINDNSIKLIFAGISSEDIQPYLDKFKITNPVHVLGKVAPEDILSIYRLLDVNILASTMDGFGLVLVEAMAMECPVIATDFGGIPDVVKDGQNGFLFQNGNIGELKAKILILLEDQQIRNKFIKNGLSTAFEKFTMEKTVQGYEQYFSNLIKEN